MSAYKDFVSDFPARCLDVLHMAKRPARGQQREVTLALMVASAGFVVPFERLKKAHPTGDSTRYAEASRKMDVLMAERFLSSRLAYGATSWQGGKLESISGDPDFWIEMAQAKKLSDEKTVGGVVRILRKALAHGNIFTYMNPIESIIFCNCNYDDDKNIKEISFIKASPEDFVAFLRDWFEFLESAHTPTDVVATSTGNAA